MAGDDALVEELSEGDCLFQPEQEIFYVVTGTDDDSVHFAIHGWRSIGKERLEGYLNPDGDQFLLREEELREMIDEEEAHEQFDRLKDMVFTVYADEDKYADPEA